MSKYNNISVKEPLLQNSYNSAQHKRCQLDADIFYLLFLA